jgi:response regulator RpfG family c-di-GMP phosphodiesterase/DNA-binding CsgD family transcriptional regulator
MPEDNSLASPGVSSMSDEPESLRAADVIATVCLATDLGMGFPLDHGCHATLMAVRFCDVLGVDVETTNQVYYGSMLMYTGCTSDAALGPPILGGNKVETLVPHLFGSYKERFGALVRSLPSPDASPIGQTVETISRFPRLIANSREQQAALCEVAEMLSRRLGLPSDIYGLFTFLTERWDGNSILKRAEGDDVPLAVRIFVFCRDVAFQRLIGGDAHAVQVARERTGHAFDPDIAKAFVSHADEVFDVTVGIESSWDAILEAEPKPWNILEEEEIGSALAAIGDFADLISPTLAAHSAGLSDLVARAGAVAGMDMGEIRDLSRAARVHDVGRVAISPEVWEKTTPLSRDEHEQVRLHPYHTERILSQSPFFRPLGDIARDHHERLDGSGYHRGVEAASLRAPARLLAAADTFRAMIESRPHRPARDPADAAKELARLADEGRLDHAMVAAVIEAAGQPVPDMERPAGLTGREAEVIGLLARGMQTKQIATALGISPKTADTHIQSGYRKMGVSTRAAATLFAMEHGMVPSGELPIPD